MCFWQKWASGSKNAWELKGLKKGDSYILGITFGAFQLNFGDAFLTMYVLEANECTFQVSELDTMYNMWITANKTSGNQTDRVCVSIKLSL